MDDCVNPDDLKRLERKIDQVISLLTGDTTPERGVLVRLDRVEQFISPLGYGGKSPFIDKRVEKLEQFSGTVTAVFSRFILPLLVAETLGIISFVIGVVTHTIKVSF
jgi:hypothetical protein